MKTFHPLNLILAIGANDVVTYKLLCRCPKKNLYFIQASSNKGTLDSHSCKKIRIRIKDSSTKNAMMKVLFGNLNFTVKNNFGSLQNL